MLDTKTVLRDRQVAADHKAAPQLKRSLSFADLIIYGLVYIGPIAPFAAYGFVNDLAKGMVVLVYLVSGVAMLFTACSYKMLSADFPLAGSAYAYARRAIGEKTGFIAGWMLVLDYILMPAAVTIAASIALHEVLPLVPRWILAISFVGAGVVINYIGLQLAAIVNKIIMLVQLAMAFAFISLGAYAIYHGAGAGHLTMKPLYQPGVFNVKILFSAVALASISYLGFDGISTLAEEVKGDSRRLVGRATLATLFLAALLFTLQTWVAADLANGMRFASPETAFYEIAAIAGGKLFSSMAAIVCAVTFGLTAASVVPASISRLLFAMARDGRMPSFMATVHPRFGTPYMSVLLVGLVSLVMSLVFLDHLDTIALVSNFGALIGFLLLHVTVIVHFVVRQGSRAYFKHLACPAIGFAILAYVLFSMAPSAWELGLSWLAGGLIILAISSVRKMRPMGLPPAPSA
jgi:amino acid transporter